MWMPPPVRRLLRPLSRKLKLEWLPALGRTGPVDRVRVVRLSWRLGRTPGSAAEHVSLGRALLRLGHDEDGLAQLRRAIELEPDRLRLYRDLGNELYFRGDNAGARRVNHAAVVRQRELAETLNLSRLGVRFLGQEWTAAIGHIAHLDFYVKLSILTGTPLERRVLLASLPSPNLAYLDYWRRLFPIVIDDPDAIRALMPVVQYLGEHISVHELPDGRVATLQQAAAWVEERWRAEERPPLLQLAREDERRGQETLERLGVPAGTWFVALHVREASRDARDIHNADVMTYTDAIDAITSRGGWVVRTGDPGMRRLPRMDQVVDYAHSDLRCDWMDVFLWARCRFFVGTTSGPVGVPPTFGVPCVQTNWCPLGVCLSYPGDLVIPKLYYSEREARCLTVGEALACGVGYMTSSRPLAQRGIRTVDNTPEELAEVVVEMLARTDGTARYTEEDERLQQLFASLDPKEESARVEGSRLGRDWLRRHADLLR